MKADLLASGLRSLRSASVWRSIALAAIASIAASEILAMGGMWLMVDFESMPPQDVRDTIMTSIVLSALVPGIIAPVVALFYQTIIHKLQDTQAELVRLARSDFLTGLLNRHGFYESAKTVIADARDKGEPVATLILDVDHFKVINDTYGHSFGDTALCHVADRIRDCSGDAVTARIGGEEFAVMVSGLPIRDVLALAEELRAACANTPLLFEDEAISMTVSIGAAIASHRDAEIGDLLKRADIALYRAKEAGRNRVTRAA